MFLNRVNFKIALTFTLFTTLVSIILFSALSFLLTNYYKTEDYRQLNVRLATMEGQYKLSGINAITSVDVGEMIQYGKPYFIRVTKDKFQLALGPLEWQRIFDYELLNGKKNGELTKLSSSEVDYQLDVLTHILDDGSILQTGISDQHRTQVLSSLNRVFIILLIPLVIISLIFGVFYSSNTLKPVSDLTETIKGIIKTGKKRPDIRKYNNKNELSELIILFNTLFNKNENLIKGMKETLDNVSHDLRTPLTRIRGISEIALTNSNPEQWQEALSDIIEDIDIIIRILNALLDITAAESGVLKLKIKEFNLKTLLEKSIDLYNFIAEEKEISISLDYKIDREIVNADEEKIRQVVANLLDNAVKYTENGGNVTVTAEQTESDWVIHINDSGIGISQDEVGNIWRRLYRSTKSRTEPGLGLGLSMVQAIINSHGGKVEVKSELGEGSTFTTTLPFQISNIEET